MTLRTASCPRALFRLGLAARLDPPGDDPLDRLRRPPAFSSSVPATFRGSDATGAIPGSSPLPGKCPPGPPTPCAYPWCSGPLRAHQHPALTPGAPGPSGPTNTRHLPLVLRAPPGPPTPGTYPWRSGPLRAHQYPLRCREPVSSPPADGGSCSLMRSKWREKEREGCNSAGQRVGPKRDAPTL